MRIGILTYHRVINYGAFLQAYSLMKVLKHILPDAQIELIDYYSVHHKQMYTKILKEAIIQRKWGKVKQFYLFYKAQKRFNLSKKIKGNSEEEIEKKISDIRYDVIVVGSDEVWRGDDKVFWLKDVQTSKKISYAASSRMQFSEIPLKEKEYICSALNDFMYVGVRDTISKLEFEKNINKAVHLNCDPTFLYNFKYEKESFKKEFCKKRKISEKYSLIGIMLDGNEELCRQVKKFYGNNCYLLSLYTPHDEADANILDISPVEWVKVINCLDCLVTSYFHGVVFAIKGNTNFVAIDYLSQESSKIYDLLSRENLLMHYMNGREKSVKEQGRLMKKVLEKVKNQKSDFSIVTNHQRAYFKDFRKGIKAITKEKLAEE